MCVASSILWHAIKYANLLNLYTTLEMLSLPFLVLGNPNTKSIEISIQGWVGTGKGVYNPYGKDLDLAYLHAIHLEQILSTSLCMWC